MEEAGGDEGFSVGERDAGIEAAPDVLWGEVLDRVVFAYPAVQKLAAEVAAVG